MRMRRRYLAWMVTVVLVTSLSLALTAQEQPKPEAKQAQNANAQKSDEKPATPAVPPEMLKEAKSYKGSATPPKKLEKKDDHWSPYTLPEKPPEGAELYVIQKGDSLSLMAQRQLGNKYLWPQIWDSSTPISRTPTGFYPRRPPLHQETQGGERGGAFGGNRTPSCAKSGWCGNEEAPLPPVNAYDIYCSGFITKKWKRPHLAILSAPQRERESLAAGFVVYLDEGTAEGMQAGVRLGRTQRGTEDQPSDHCQGPRGASFAEWAR